MMTLTSTMSMVNEYENDDVNGADVEVPMDVTKTGGDDE